MRTNTDPRRALCYIPNSRGFKLDLHTKTGAIQSAIVARNAGGCHYLTTPAGQPLNIRDFRAWTPRQ